MFDNVTIAQLCEAAMLICFDVSWPISILKTVKTKNPKGKSLLFTTLVIVGYIAGCMYKITGKMDFVFGFYVLNVCNATIDLILCRYYLSKIKEKKNAEIGCCSDSPSGVC